MKKLIILLSLVMVLTLSACNTNSGSSDVVAPESAPEAAEEDAEESAAGTYNQISMQQALQMMEEQKDYLIVDVRTAGEYAEGHIPGAVNVANETIAEEAETALPDKDQMLFVYCRSGNRSKVASQVLADLGYTNVYEFGGIKDWTGDIEK